MEIDTGFFCLGMLDLAGNIICFTVFNKIRPSLFKSKGDPGINTLLPNIQHPLIPAGTGILAGFSAHCYRTYCRDEILP